MLVTVFKGDVPTEHEANLAVPVNSEGSVMVQLKGDTRKLSVILADFEDADVIQTDDGRRWEGYGDVIVGYRMDPATVQVRIRRSVTNE